MAVERASTNSPAAWKLYARPSNVAKCTSPQAMAWVRAVAAAVVEEFNPAENMDGDILQRRRRFHPMLCRPDAERSSR